MHGEHASIIYTQRRSARETRKEVGSEPRFPNGSAEECVECVVKRDRTPPSPLPFAGPQAAFAINGVELNFEKALTAALWGDDDFQRGMWLVAHYHASFPRNLFQARLDPVEIGVGI